MEKQLFQLINLNSPLDIESQQLIFNDYIVNQLISIIQSDIQTHLKCNSIITHQYSPWIYFELISTVTLRSNIFNRNPTPQLLFQCSELFENANQDFIDYLFNPIEGFGEEMKHGLFRYLITLVELDTIQETTCGYFYKVMNSIIQKRGIDVWNYLENDQRIISSFLKHIDQPHICRIITELIIFGNQPSKIIDYSNLIQSLSDRLFKIMIKKSYQNTIVDNISEIYIEILTRKSQNPNLEISQIILLLQPSKLFEIAIQSNSEGPYTILNLLLEYFQNNQQDHIDQFFNILHLIPQEFQKTYQNNNQYDRYFNKLFCRKNMRLLNLTLQLIQLNNKLINSKLLDNGLVNILINTICQFPFHNQLHFISFVIFEKLIDSDQMDIQIIDSLLNFIIIQLNQIQQQIIGFKGFLSKLANYLINKQNNQLILKAMKNNQQWEGFCQTTLKNINQIEQNFYFDFNPRKSNSEESNQNIQEQQKQQE